MFIEVFWRCSRWWQLIVHCKRQRKIDNVKNESRFPLNCKILFVNDASVDFFFLLLKEIGSIAIRKLKKLEDGRKSSRNSRDIFGFSVDFSISSNGRLATKSRTEKWNHTILRFSDKTQKSFFLYFFLSSDHDLHAVSSKSFQIIFFLMKCFVFLLSRVLSLLATK